MIRPIVVALMGLLGLALEAVGSPVDAQPYAYVTSDYKGVLPIDTATGLPVPPWIGVAQYPSWIAVMHDGSRAYTSHDARTYGGQLCEINTSSNASACFDADPLDPNLDLQGVAFTPNDALLYVTTGTADSVKVVDTVTKALHDTIPLGLYAYRIAITPSGDYAYVTTWNGYAIVKISLSNNAVVGSIGTGTFAPREIAITPDGMRAYIAADTQRVLAINLLTDRMFTTIEFNFWCTPGGLAILPDGTRAYVACESDNSVAVIDLRTNSLVKRVPLAKAADTCMSPFSVAVTPDGGEVYVTCSVSYMIAIVETASDEVRKIISVDASPHAIAIAPGPAAVPQPPVLLATGPGPGGGPHVRVFDAATSPPKVLCEFMAYSPMFTGGVRVALGDVGGDGIPDIVTAPGATGGPHVRVFDGGYCRIGQVHVIRDFFAYAPGFYGGVTVGTADVNRDGFADIITGAGPGGGPHVRVFDGQTGKELRSFSAYDPAFSGGVFVGGGGP